MTKQPLAELVKRLKFKEKSCRSPSGFYMSAEVLRQVVSELEAAIQEQIDVLQEEIDGAKRELAKKGNTQYSAGVLLGHVAAFKRCIRDLRGEK